MRIALVIGLFAGVALPATLAAQNARKVKTVEFTGDLGFVYGRSEGETIANNWRGSGRDEYGLSKRLFLYAMAGAERNRFAGIQRRFEEGPGLIYKLLMAPKDILDLEAGVSAVQQRPTSGVDDNEDYRINTETAFVAPISSNFALKAACVVRFDNTPLVTATKTFKKTDRIFTTGIQNTY